MIPALLLIGLGIAAPVPAQSEGNNAETVAWLLNQRCSKCHSPGSDEPRASRHWSDAGSLAATAANRDLVEPGDPTASTLYWVLQDKEMPPADSGVPTLTEEELGLVAAWIREGAITTERSETPKAGPTPEDGTGLEKVSVYQGWMHARIASWVARFHPMLVHFPIALLIASLVAELLSKAVNRPGLRSAATFCLVAGAIGAVPTAALGWLLAVDSSHPPDALALHRWLGLSTVMASMAALWVVHKRPAWRLPILLVLAAMVGATGHAGASLSFGPHWLSWPG